MDAPLTNTLVDDPALWRLSLMIGADRLDVVARRTVGEPESLSASIALSPAAASPAAALEEAVYANPLLLSPFDKTDIVLDGGFTLVVPPGTHVDAVDALLPAADAEVTAKVALDSRNELVYRTDRQTANFVQRTFGSVAPTHSLAVLARYFAHQSRLGNSSKMFVDLGPTTMNVLIFNQLGLAMASAYHCPDINDAAYYALAAANTAGLDFTYDEIRIAGHSERRAELTPVLRKFVRQVMPSIVPTGAFNGNSALLSAPFPLLIIPLCE